MKAKLNTQPHHDATAHTAWLCRVMFILLLAMAILLCAGCASKSEPVIITQLKEIKTPIKCIDKMPTKPPYNADEKEQSALNLSAYFLEVETLLKRCSSE